MFRSVIIYIAIYGALFVTAAAQTSAPTPPQRPEDVAVPTIAPDHRSDDRSLPELERVGVDTFRQRTISLAEALELALLNNRDIEVARKTSRIAELDLAAARGLTEPRLSGQWYYDRTTLPNVSIFTANQKTTNGTLFGNLLLTGQSQRYGTLFQGALNNQRLTSNNPISVLSPQLNTGLSFAVTQPLFRGRQFDQIRRGIEIAKRNIELTDTQFRLRSIEAVATVEKAYWELVFALRNLQVQRDAVRDARQQLEHNRRLVTEGQLAPIDIVAAETQVANFEQAVYEALNGVNVAENAIKNLVSPNRAGAIWAESLVPLDSVEIAVPDITLNDALEAALKNRPELEINSAQREMNAQDQRFFREQKKPQIDVFASVSENGIGGAANPDFSPTFPTACTIDPASPACAQQQAALAMLVGNPLRGIFTHRYPTVRVGVSFNFPLFGDRTSDANHGKTLVEAERLETQREQLEQGIQVEVRNALQAVRTAEARLRSAAIARENLVRQYDSERRKLDEGQSDIYKVLERQTALTAGRGNELRSRTELNKAVSELNRVTGRTLTANNIETKLRK